MPEDKDLFDEAFGGDSKKKRAEEKPVRAIGAKKEALEGEKPVRVIGAEKEPLEEAPEEAMEREEDNPEEDVPNPEEEVPEEDPSDEEDATASSAAAPNKLKRAKKQKKPGIRMVNPAKEPVLREKIKKIVVAKAVKAAEKELVPPDRELGTKEVGVKEGEKASEAAEQEKPKVSLIKPELSFLKDDGKAFIGRKKSVFQKYGDQAALFIGKVAEQDLNNTDICLDSLNPHVVFVCGARGSGKCLHGDTLIALNDGRLLPIKELKETNAKVLALDHGLKITDAEKIAFSERKANKLLRIALRSGKSIKLTPEHPLLTVNGWMQANELEVGSRIATPRILGAFGKNIMGECEVKLLAYLIAEGHLGNQFVLFSNSDKIIMEDFKRAVNEFDAGLDIRSHGDDCIRIVQKKKKIDLSHVVRNEKGQFTSRGFVVAQKSSLMHFFESVGLYSKLSKEKFIPKEVMQLEKIQLALFLNRLFSCDGSIYRINKGKTWGACYASSSAEIARQVQHLLLRFGINATLREKKVKCNNKQFDSYEVVLYGENVLRFISEIGFFGEKQLKEEKAIEEALRVRRNPNIDTIPKEIWGQYKPKNWKATARALGYAAKSFHSTVNYAPSRNKLLKIALVDENKGAKMLAQSDIFWDEITEMEEIIGETMVYDIEVPSVHNFVANDIIVHNSYVLGVIAEELAVNNKNVGVIVVDPVGVFWGMRYPNREKRELEALAKWEMLPQGLENLKVFIPEGAAGQVPKSTYDDTFSIPPALLTVEDWCLTFGIERFSPSGLLMEKGLQKVKEGYTSKDGKNVKGKRDNFSLEDLIECLQTDEELNSGERGYKGDSIRALSSRFDAAENWGIFDDKGTPLAELSNEGQLTVIDTSFLEDNVSALVIGLLARRILAARKVSTRRESAKQFSKDESMDHLLEFGIPPTWLFIDEAHTLIPSGNVVTPASSALIEYVKQGRQPGCSLVFATQQPSAINTKVLSQLDIVISHKLVFDDDVKAVYKRIPTLVPKAYRKNTFIKTLPVGVALVGDRREETTRSFVMKIRPRMSQHEGREAETVERNLKLDDDKVRLLALQLAKNKLDRVGSLETGMIDQVVKTLNSKYKSKVKLSDVLKALEEEGAIIDEENSTVSMPGEVQEEALAEELVGEAEKEVEKEAKAVFPEETIELLAFPANVSGEKARVLFNKKRKRRVLGLFGSEEAIENIQLRYLPVYRVEFNAFDSKQTFRKGEAYINSVTREFIHFDEKRKQFVESRGLNFVNDLSKNEINVLMLLERKREFPAIVRDSKESSTVVRRILQSLQEKGFVAREKVKGMDFYSRSRPIELPFVPLHPLLGSMNRLPVLNIEAMSLMREGLESEKVPKMLGKLWKNVVVKRIELVYLPVYETFMRKKDGKVRKAFIEAVTGKGINLGQRAA